MKASSAIGLVVAIVGLYLGATMEGSNPMAILSPSAMLIVLGGTLGAVIIGTSFASITNIPKMYMKAFNPPQHDLNAKVAELVGYAEAARRDGLLALDEVTSTIEDPYTRKGLQLVVDGTDPDLVADILESENDAMRKRHAASVQPFDKAGGYAPTMGIIGTVFGLIHVLGNLDKPATLGPSISAAFVATLLGVASANVIYLPICARLKQLSQEELHARALIVEGILSIQAGDNPRVVQEKLITFVPPALRVDADAGQGRRTPRRRPRNPSWPVTSDTSRWAPRGGARERGALARVLRGHDDAPVLPLHGALRDLVGEHVEVRGAPAVAQGRVLGRGARRRPVDAQLGLGRGQDQAVRGRAAAAVAAPADVDQQHERQERPPRRPTKAKQEEQDFRKLKRRVDKLAKEAGLRGKVNVTVRRRGLVIQLLTDKVFFSSGEAILHPEAHKLVAKIGEIVRDERSHPVVVEGYTDSQPISNSRYQSNWDLSGARAAAVVNDFAKIGVLAEPDVRAGLRQPDPDRHAIPRRKAVRRTAGWRSSSPASTPAAPTRSQPPSAWRR